MVILVAGSGRLRKSTAIRLPNSLLRNLNINILDGKTSPEKLLSILGAEGVHTKQGIITVLAPELSVFYSRQQYAESLIDIITDLSDAPDRKDFPTQKGGNIWVQNACVTFLGCSTPSSIAEGIPVRALQHGFMSRHIFVYAATTDRKESLSETRADPAKVKWAERLKNQMILGLERMNLLSGPFEFSPAAKDWYDDWYNKFSTVADKEGEGWVSRRHDHMLRTAMLLQVCKDLSLVFETSVLQAADSALTMVEDSMPEAFAQIGIHSNASGVDRIINVFKKQGGRASNWDIFDKAVRYFPDPSALKRAMTGLLQAGWIKRIDWKPAQGLEIFALVRPDERSNTNGSGPQSSP